MSEVLCVSVFFLLVKILTCRLCDRCRRGIGRATTAAVKIGKIGSTNANQVGSLGVKLLLKSEKIDLC